MWNELFLLESSDWLFINISGQNISYGAERMKTHIDNLSALSGMLGSSVSLDEMAIGRIEKSTIDFNENEMEISDLLPDSILKEEGVHLRNIPTDPYRQMVFLIIHNQKYFNQELCLAVEKPDESLKYSVIIKPDQTRTIFSVFYFSMPASEYQIKLIGADGMLIKEMAIKTPAGFPFYIDLDHVVHPLFDDAKARSRVDLFWKDQIQFIEEYKKPYSPGDLHFDIY